MSDLLSNLSMAARAMAAQRTGLDVVGQNIANVNTAGYSRRTVDLASVPPTDRWSAGGGVDVVGIRSIRDAALERRLQLERPAEGRESALSDALDVIEAAIGQSGSSVDGQISSFFDAWSTLAEDPTSSTMRQGVLIQANSLATSINGVAERLQAARDNADSAVRADVADINELVQKIASLNKEIGATGGGNMALSLRDSQTETIRQLSALIDVSVSDSQSGGIDVSFANGRSLVVGAHAIPLEVKSSASGYSALYSGGVDVTSQVTGGEIGGQLHARDVLIPDYLDTLDTLAYSVATTVNTQHAAGYDLDGNAGGPIFTPLASASGAARAIAVDPTIAADPRKIAASGASSGGDNTNARAMATLRDAKVTAGGAGTLTDAWAEFVYKVGQDSSTAKTELQNRRDILSQLESLRDQMSGVSLDEEAMMMMKFQRAYEANARYFATIDSAIDVLMQALGS